MTKGICYQLKLTRGELFIWYCGEYMRAASWQNQQNGLCAQWILRSAWASVQSDQSLHCPHKENLDHKLPPECTAKMPRLIWVFAGHTCNFVGFVMLRVMYDRCWFEIRLLTFCDLFNFVEVPMIQQTPLLEMCPVYTCTCSHSTYRAYDLAVTRI